MGQYLAVRSRLEERASVLQIFAQLLGVDEVAVMGKSEISGTVPEQERLHILDTAATRRRVANMADCRVSF